MPVQQIAVTPAPRPSNAKKDCKPKPSPLKKKDGAKVRYESKYLRRVG